MLRLERAVHFSPQLADMGKKGKGGGKGAKGAKGGGGKAKGRYVYESRCPRGL